MAVVLLFVAVLGGIQWNARWNFLTRGIPQGFSEPIADTALPSGCVNASLEQYEGERLDWALGLIHNGGFAWVRQHFPWKEIEPESGHYEWDRWDRVVTRLRDSGLKTVAVLDAAPEWVGNPPDPQLFAQYARRVAGRYGDSITYYQIWHNPNLGSAWNGKADAAAYTQLLAAAATEIRKADPDARIVLGSLAPNVEAGPQNFSEALFLEMLYANGAQNYFDVVSVQPYGFYTGPEDREVDSNLLNFSRPVLVREFLESHGDGGKAIWASDFGWNSLPEQWQGPPSIWGSVDEAQQAAYTVGALERAEREWPWMGVLCLNGFQPGPVTAEERSIPNAEGHWGFALIGADDSPRPLYSAVKEWAIRQSNHALPGVWNAATDRAVFTGTWTLGTQGADIGQSGDRVALTFEGTGVALTVRRGPYRAFLFVTVDGQPANALPRDENGQAYVVLYDPLAAVATVPLAEHLPYGVHTVEVVAERGWGQWALADWRVADTPDAGTYQGGVSIFITLGCVSLILAVVLGSRLPWLSYRRRLNGHFNRLSHGSQVVLATLTGVIFLFSSWSVWMQGAFRRLGDGAGLSAVLLAAIFFYFSPWLVVTVGSGLVLALLVFLRPDLGLALVIAAAPFHVHPLSLLGRSFSLSELVLIPTLGGWAAQMAEEWRQRWATGVKIRWLSGIFSLPTLAFCVVAIASTLLSVHRHEALRELRLVVLEPALFYMMLVTLPMGRRERWRIVDFFLLGAVLVAVLGLYQYFFLGDVITAEGGVSRLRSIYGSPNNVGLYLGRALPFLLAVVLWKSEAGQVAGNWWAQWRSDPRRLIYLIVLFPVGAALVLSLSRGAILLGVPATLVTLGFFAGGRWRKATLGVLVVLGLALIPLFSNPRFAALFDPSHGTTFLRLALWQSAWSMFKDAPLFGVGPDNFLYAYRTRYVLPTAWEEFNLSHPHNFLLDFSSRLGILGLGVFLWFQVRFWRWAIPLRRHSDLVVRVLALSAMGAMADFLAHGLVDASYFIIDLAYVFFLLMAVIEWGWRAPGVPGRNDKFQEGGST